MMFILSIIFWFKINKSAFIKLFCDIFKYVLPEIIAVYYLFEYVYLFDEFFYSVSVVLFIISIIFGFCAVLLDLKNFKPFILL